MVGLNRHILRLFMVFFTLAGITLLTHSVTRVSHAAIRQVDQPVVMNLSTYSSDVITDTVKTYLPLIQRSKTIVCGEISSDTTWTSALSPYQVTCDVIVVPGVTLTIEAGATVQFSHSEDDLIVSGTLHALGTGNAPIHFLPVSVVSAGNWGKIAFMPGSSGVLDHAILEFGGSSQGMLYIASDDVQVVNSVVQYSFDTGIYIQGASPVISATQILSNTGSSGCGLYNDTGSPTIQNNTFSGNHTRADVRPAPTLGGGLYNDTGSPIIQNNIFSANVTSVIYCSPRVCSNLSGGGGIYSRSGRPIIQNNIFTGNKSYIDFTPSQGGGLYTGGNSLIQNNTFNGNSADVGGGLYITNGNPIIRSNIIVENIDGGGISIDIYHDSFTPTLDYNDVWNNTGGNYDNVTPGMHDISADPQFKDPSNGDFHLNANSPCIDTGDPDYFPPTDFDEDPRPMGLTLDIGADEFRTLGVIKTSSPEESHPGSTITYTITLVNLSPVTLTNVLVTDTLPIKTAFIDYQGDGLTCTYEGSNWGGQLSCTVDSLSLTVGDRRMLTITVLLTETITTPQDVINSAQAFANGGGKNFLAVGRARTWVNRCAVQLNGKPMGRDLQAAIDASTQTTDVIKVTDYCHLHDLRLNKTLTLQGGWSHDFSEWDPSVYTTTLDGQKLGRVIQVDGDISPTIEDFIITGGNTLDFGGDWTGGNIWDSGGGIFISSGSPMIQHNTFIGNSAGFSGGGLYNGSGSSTIRNNIFSDNSADVGGGLYNDSGNLIIRHNTFNGNSAFSGFARGGGLFDYLGNPIIDNNTFTGNSAVSDGGMGVGSGNKIIQNNTFYNNSAAACGGLGNSSGSAIIQNNTFVSNTASDGGGGLCTGGGNPIIQNNTFSGNSASEGGGIWDFYGSSIIRSNIVVNNTAGSGGGIYFYKNNMVDYNDVWNNTSGDFYNVTPGTHDISADPRLADPLNGDFHLASNSPCIDAGDPEIYPPTDFEGDPRPCGVAPDIGADEYCSPP